MTAIRGAMSKTTDPPLKYIGAAVTLAEVPREISLTVSISNCRFRCHGCHSPELQQDVGRMLLPDLGALIHRYKGLITCVCLMGEGRSIMQQATALRFIREHGLKTCLYSGCDTSELFTGILPLLDYLKLGPYDERIGGLDKSTTNQRFYRIEAEKLIDETYLFRRKEAELHEQR